MGERKDSETVKWVNKDLEKYLTAKEYVDTAVIPLQPFQLSSDSNMGEDAFQLEVLSIYAQEIEKELSGRVLLTPTYFYLRTADLKEELTRLNNWIQDIQTQPFNEVFIFTFDNAWKKLEKDLAGNLLWFPGMKTGNIRTTEANTIIRNQVEQLSELIRSYW